MNTQSAPPSPAALLREIQARMTQALDNFFQRSRSAVEAALARSVSTHTSPSGMAKAQVCLDWISVRPQALSTAFADQFRLHLARPESKWGPDERSAKLQLMDDETFKRRLAEEKAIHEISEALRPDMLLLFGRMRALRESAGKDPRRADWFGPLPVVRALSQALDALQIDAGCGTLLLQSASAPLRDTLKHTYAALNQFLGRHNIPEAAPTPDVPRPRRTDGDAGHDILAHIKAAGAGASGSGAPEAARGPQPSPRLLDRLDPWQAAPAFTVQDGSPPLLVLRSLRQDAQGGGTTALDLAVLDAVAALFETMLDDAVVSPRYKAEVAQLQIPVLRIALSAPDFFSDPQHPARLLLDMMGQFSRRFPEGITSHEAALARVHAACAEIVPAADPAEAFAASYRTLSAWLAAEDARASDDLAADVARLEDLERQELGTLLAMENLQDLTERYPAPEAVLRRLEAAWVPYMAALYRTEAGEGPDWRAACLTLLQLFMSMQAPEDDATRESRLESIPGINAALRQGLLAQGAQAAQLKDFFGAVTATQERWIRPGVSQGEVAAPGSATHAPQPVLKRAGEPAPEPGFDDALIQAEGLLEGDWVDFEPPYEGLATARVAWVGLHGYLLFCDSQGERQFSLDCEQLAAQIHAGRALVPEQSLTRKAMLRMRADLASAAA